jgi:hypothetical protein
VRVWNLLPLLLLGGSLFAAGKVSAPVTRWEQASPGCTLRRTDDGRTYYGITSGDFEAVVAVDSRELEKIPRRPEPVVSLLLSFRYNGRGVLKIQEDRFTLEFVKHQHVIKSSFVPSDLVRQIQQNADDLTDVVERREVRMHPEQKSQKEAELQERLKEYTELVDFVSTHALASTSLSPSRSNVSGWVFFTTEDRWIGGWRKPEQFILRIPMEGVVLEFPFSLPPEGSKVQLRRRPER